MLKIPDKIHYCGIVLNKNKVIFVHRLANRKFIGWLTKIKSGRRKLKGGQE